MSGKDQVTRSLSFPKGSNCSVFSNFIPLFPRFLFPSGHDTFSVPIGHLFPIFGAELNGTFLVIPVYLHRGAPFLSLGRSLNGTFLVTPVYLHRGAYSFALGRDRRR